ncbi:MAG: PEGA domain-containing protein [Patescibacteria group bacterium]
MRTRILLFLLSLILVPTVTGAVILFARGYRFSPKQQAFQATGLLSAVSLPNGASVYINNELKSATDTTLNLTPGNYQVRIKKEGFSPWEKTLTIAPEVVTRVGPLLFPSVPSLKAVTYSGASLPAISDDGSKVAYLSASKLYTLDLSESPLGLLNRESKLIFNFKFLIFKLEWSPDNKQILLMSTPSAYLVDLSKSETQPVFDLKALQTEWNMSKDIKASRNLELLPVILKNILATAAADLVWSPRENKIMYTATASASIPDNLIRELPGSSTQPESRNLKPDTVYVYDLEEDRNFAVGEIKLEARSTNLETNSNDKNNNDQKLFRISDFGFRNCNSSELMWFSDSNHLVCVQNSKIIIVEYDGQNPTLIYSGPMENRLAAPYPSSKQMLILTNLTGNPAILPNLYAVSLR